MAEDAQNILGIIILGIFGFVLLCVVMWFVFGKQSTTRTSFNILNMNPLEAQELFKDQLTPNESNPNVYNPTLYEIAIFQKKCAKNPNDNFFCGLAYPDEFRRKYMNAEEVLIQRYNMFIKNHDLIMGPM